MLYIIIIIINRGDSSVSCAMFEKSSFEYLFYKTSQKKDLN